MNYRVVVLSGLLCWSGIPLFSFYVDKIDRTPCRKKDTYQAPFDMYKYFSLSRPIFKRESVVTDPIALQQAVRDARDFLQRYNRTHKPVVAPQPFSTQILSYHKVAETLDFIDQVIEEDKEKGEFRILDPHFLTQNLGFISWRPDPQEAQRFGHHGVTNKKIRLTSYVIYRAAGSYEKTPQHSYALYRLLNEKKTISLSKQELLGGALEGNQDIVAKIQPLAWVSRETLEEAMLQGTVLLSMPDGKERAFTVNISNGHKFERGVRNLADQKIYWFFLERKNEAAVKTLLDRAMRRKNVIFAGDLYSLGLGKLIVMQYYNRKTRRRELRLGVLGDTGSAFDNNLYHLDLFGGIIANRQQLKQHLANFPPAVKAFVVYKK